MSVGSGISLTALILSWEGLTPSPVMVYPKYWHYDAAMIVFSTFSLSPYFRSLHNAFSTTSKCF